MSTCWTVLITKTITNSMGGTALINPETYTVTLPPSLNFNDAVIPHKFVTKSSRPSALKGVDKGSQVELLSAIASLLNRDFGIPVGVRNDSGNAIKTGSTKETLRKLILVGASNLHRTANSLKQLGWDVVDLSAPGWVATPANVEEMANKLRQLEIDEGTAVVFDLFGNSAYRYESYDGSILTPVKIGGGYHLVGDVKLCTDSIFSRQVDTVLPLLEAAKGVWRIIIPPQPRYLYSGCCTAEGHCTNISSPSHAEKLMGDVLHVRDVLKRKLLNKLDGKFWLADSCMASTVSADKTAKERAESLRTVSAMDGVHYTGDGCNVFAHNIANTAQGLGTGKMGPYKKQFASSSSVAGPGRVCNHYWKGVTSPVGSSKPATFTQSQKSRREKQTKFAPYARGGGGDADGKLKVCGLRVALIRSQTLIKRKRLKSGPSTF
jgi:hypothetical protein